MTLAKKTVAALAVVMVVTAAWWVNRAKAVDLDGDGRGQTAAWVMDPTNPAHLSATVTTTNPSDFKVEVELKDAAGVELSWFENSFTPSPGGQGHAQLNDPLPSYPSGSTFTITGRYYDAAGLLIDTEVVNFTKP